MMRWEAVARTDWQEDFANGLGVSRDPEKAEFWRRKAAAQGYPRQQAASQQIGAGEENVRTIVRVVAWIAAAYVAINLLRGDSVGSGRDRAGSSFMTDEAEAQFRKRIDLEQRQSLRSKPQRIFDYADSGSDVLGSRARLAGPRQRDA